MQHFQAAIARRARHEPVQHIIGTQEFYGRPFIVNSLVLIPRPETEHLVEAALAIRPAPSRIRPFRVRPFRILDIGTGSGILAITLALELARRRHHSDGYLRRRTGCRTAECGRARRG